MRIFYSPNTKLEKFADTIYNLLVEKSKQTFFVGGMVRDLLLKKNILDIDIATSLKPDQIMKVLEAHSVNIDKSAKEFGVIKALKENFIVEIATLRTESYSKSRYPKIKFINNPFKDSQRRDFTANALYYSPKTGKILDFHNGIMDIKEKRLKFIGNPKIRIQEDPLRIIRAIRFCINLNFILEKNSYNEILNNFNLINNLSLGNLKKEISKISI